ncbi:LysR substrate-binding domain-containing protein [Microtetraspora niveoalba]|uniref:LysR substrate-binding domain-containing protein n=1 Tax=Microtetraspora niveoalba TaxID=46175 RepID=UPI000836C2A0|nr:LysR substrate-binding domain-containing protein [Microtetraspora niveoalba]
MDLVRHLRYFVVIAEELHFGNAAARLGMAQPPLSQRVKRLEDELGVRLFDRTSRQVRLTDAGRLLLPEARDLVARAERIRELMARTVRGDTASLRAAVPPDLGASVLAALIARFRAGHPDVRLTPAEMGTSDQVDALLGGELDLGVLRHPVAASGLGFGPILVQHPGVLLREEDELAGLATVHLADLAGRELVLPPRALEPGLHDETLAGCRRYGFVPAEVRHAVHGQFTIGLVLAGSAVAFGRSADVPGVAWRPLAGSPLVWRTSTAWRGEPSEHVAGFADLTTRVLREDAGMSDEGASPRTWVAPRPATGFLS